MGLGIVDRERLRGAGCGFQLRVAASVRSAFQYPAWSVVLGAGALGGSRGFGRRAGLGGRNPSWRADRSRRERVADCQLVGMAIRGRLRTSGVHRQPADRGDLRRRRFRQRVGEAAPRARGRHCGRTGNRALDRADASILDARLADARHHLGSVSVAVSDVPMKRTSFLIAAGVAIMLTALAVYLRDPPWAGSITSGMRAWEEDPPGTRFR